MENESVKEQVLKNSIWYFLMTIFTKIGGIVFMMLLTRMLLPEKYGIYSLTVSIALLILTLTTGGTLKTLSKSVSESLGKNKKKLASSYYHFLLKVQFILSGSSVALLLILAYPLSFFVFKKPALFCPLILSSTYIAAYYLQNFHEFLFYATKKVKYLLITGIIIQISKIVLLLALFTLITKEYYVSGTIVVLALSSLITLFFLFVFLKKRVNFIFEKSKAKINKKRTIKLLINLIFSGISTTILEYLDIIILGIFLASAYVGYYSAAFAIIGSIYTLISISNILLPVFTQMQKERLSDAFNKVSKYISIISIPIIFGLLSLGRWLLNALYGSEYIEAALPLLFLSIMIFEFPMINSLNSLFFSKEEHKPVIKLTILSIVLNLFLNIPLILILMKISMIWAVTGVAIANSVSRMFMLIGLSIVAHKKLGVHYNIKFLLKPLIAGAIMAAVLFLINSQIKNLTLLIGIFEIILGALLYITVLILIKGITKEDYLLLKFLKPKFKKLP